MKADAVVGQSSRQTGRSSVQLRTDLRQLILREHVIRLDRQRRLELFDRLVEQSLGAVDAAEVAVREVARLVAGCGNRALQPRDGFVELPFVDEIRADVVVRVSKTRVDGDG